MRRSLTTTITRREGLKLGIDHAKPAPTGCGFTPRPRSRDIKAGDRVCSSFNRELEGTFKGVSTVRRVVHVEWAR